MSQIHSAAQRGDLGLLKQLLVEQGDVDLNAADSNGNTPLHLAAQEGHLDVVEHLLLAGIGKIRSVKNRYGQFPADLARTNLHPAVMRVLEAQFKTTRAVEALPVAHTEGTSNSDINRWSAVANNLKDELFRQTEKNYAIMREKEKVVRELEEAQLQVAHLGHMETEVKLLREGKTQLLAKIDALQKNEVAYKQEAQARESEQKEALLAMQEKAKALERYDSQLAHFQEKLNEVSREKAEALTRERETRRECDEVRLQLRVLEEETKAKDRLNAVTDNHDARMAEKVKELKAALDALEDENRSLCRTTREAEQELALSTMKKEQAQAELERVREEAKASTTLMVCNQEETIQRELSRVKGELAIRQADLDDLKVTSLRQISEAQLAREEATRHDQGTQRELERTSYALKRALEDIAELRESNKAVGKELYDSRMKVEKLQLESQSLVLENDRERNAERLTSLENKMYLERTQSDLKEAKEQLAEQKAALSKLSNDAVEAREALYRHRTEAEKHRKEADAANEELRKAKAYADEKAEAGLALNARIAMMQKELEDMCAKLDEETKAKANLAAKLDDMSNAQGKSMGDYERLRADHLKSVTAAMEKERQSALLHSELKNKMQQLEGKLQVIEKEYDLANTKLKQSQETYWHQNDQIAKLTSDLKDANKELESRAATLTSISSERESAEADMTSKLREIREKLQETTSALEAKTDLATKQEAELTALKKDKSDLEAQLLFSKDKQELMDRESATANKKVQEMAKQATELSILERERTDLQAQLVVCKDKLQTLEVQRVEEKEKAKKAHAEEVAGLEETVAKLRTRIAEQTQKTEVLSEGLEVLEKEFNALNKEVTGRKEGVVLPQSPLLAVPDTVPDAEAAPGAEAVAELNNLKVKMVKISELEQELRIKTERIEELEKLLASATIDTETRLKILRSELEVERKQRMLLESAFKDSVAAKGKGECVIDLLDFKQQVAMAENAMVAAKGEMLSLMAAEASEEAMAIQKVEVERMEDVYKDARATLESAQDIHNKLEESGLGLMEMARLSLLEIEDLKERLNMALTEQAEQAAIMFAAVQAEKAKASTSTWGLFGTSVSEEEEKAKLPLQIEKDRLQALLEKEKEKLRKQMEEEKEQIALNMAIEIEEERLFLQEKMEVVKRKLKANIARGIQPLEV